MWDQACAEAKGRKEYLRPPESTSSIASIKVSTEPFKIQFPAVGF
jgi:hypothetical protein